MIDGYLVYGRIQTRESQTNCCCFSTDYTRRIHFVEPIMNQLYSDFQQIQFNFKINALGRSFMRMCVNDDGMMKQAKARRKGNEKKKIKMEHKNLTKRETPKCFI